MQVEIRSGIWATRWHQKKASTAFTKGELVDLVANRVQPSTSSTVIVYGVNQDSEYESSDTSEVKIPVLVPRGLGVVAMQASGTLTDADVGEGRDLTNSQTVNANAGTNDAVRVLEIEDLTNKIVKVVINPFILA